VTGDHNASPDPAAGEPGEGVRHRPGGHWHRGMLTFARSGFIEYDRVLFFSDAVFAIAITLLAIDLKVLPSPKAPQAIHGHLHHAVSTSQIDKYGLISFGISFAVIGLFWLGHHGIFRYIVALDRPLTSINLFFLGTIALLPYPTRLLELGKSGSTGIVFYAICTAAAGLGQCAIWLYATRPGSGLAAQSAAAIRLRYALRIARVPVVFLASIPVALVAPADAPYIWILVFIFGLLINRFWPQPDEPEPIGEEIRPG
jgi:uncharacterized membrane protein